MFGSPLDGLFLNCQPECWMMLRVTLWGRQFARFLFCFWGLLKPASTAQMVLNGKNMLASVGSPYTDTDLVWEAACFESSIAPEEPMSVIDRLMKPTHTTSQESSSDAPGYPPKDLKEGRDLGMSDVEVTGRVQLDTDRCLSEPRSGILILKSIMTPIHLQIEEETGIELSKEDMVELTAFFDPSTGHKIYPSPISCHLLGDEEISLFLYKGKVSKEIIEQLQGKETGLREHGELIKVHLVPYAQLWRLTPDAKAVMAIALYEMAKRDGLLSHLRERRLEKLHYLGVSFG